MVLAFVILATTAEWILFHTLRSPSFCLEGNGSANCAGTKTGWRREAVKDNGAVLKPTNEWRGLWPAAPLSLCSVGHFPHIQCVHSWLSGLFWGLREYACPKSQAWPPGWELPPVPVSSSISQEGPSSILHPPSGIVERPALQALCASVNYNPGGFVLSVTQMNFSLGFRILFQTKTYTRETVWQYFPTFKAGGESQGCTSRLG